MSDLDEAVSGIRHRFENAENHNSSLPPNPWSIAETIVLLYDRMEALREDHADLWRKVYGYEDD